MSLQFFLINLRALHTRLFLFNASEPFLSFLDEGMYGNNAITRFHIRRNAPPIPVRPFRSAVDILVTPVGDNYASALPRSLSIRLVPAGTVIPPAIFTADFQFSPVAQGVPACLQNHVGHHLASVCGIAVGGFGQSDCELVGLDIAHARHGWLAVVA